MFISLRLSEKIGEYKYYISYVVDRKIHEMCCSIDSIIYKELCCLLKAIIADDY